MVFETIDMADLEPLVNATDLKTDRFFALTSKDGVVQAHYDETVDALMLMFVPIEIETFVHYVDDAIGLLCTIDTLQVVGFRIESFKKSFLPQHADAKRIWSIKATDLVIQDLGDFLFLAEQNKLTIARIAREIVKITRATLGKNQVRLALPQESEMVLAGAY